MRHAVDRAVRVALYERTVTCIILPNAIQEETYQKPERAHGTVHSSVGYSVPRVLPRQPDLRRAADVLNAQYLQIRKGMMASLSGNLATMGCAVPYAIGAKFAFPHRPILAVAGDGAMQMNGNGEEAIRGAAEWMARSVSGASVA